MWSVCAFGGQFELAVASLLSAKWYAVKMFWGFLVVRVSRLSEGKLRGDTSAGRVPNIGVDGCFSGLHVTYALVFSTGCSGLSGRPGYSAGFFLVAVTTGLRGVG